MESTFDIFGRALGPLVDSSQRGISRLIAQSSGERAERENPGTSRAGLGLYGELGYLSSHCLRLTQVVDC
jgi:hypothetical protein